MRIFDGLTAQDRDLLRRSAELTMLEPGQVLFREHDPAYGLYCLASGRLEVVRRSGSQDVVVGLIEADQVFGELGFLRAMHTRTATVRAVERSGVLHIPSGSIASFLEHSTKPTAPIRLFQNLVCILADRLRAVESPSHPRVQPEVDPTVHYAFQAAALSSETTFEESLEEIKAAVPQGFFSTIFTKKTLKPGATLCCAGDEPDGFYIVTEGTLAVERADAVPASAIAAPAVAGEVGYFAGRPRSATLRAQTAVAYTHFRDADFKRLTKDDPERALQVLRAAAQLIVLLILRRESA